VPGSDALTMMEQRFTTNVFRGLRTLAAAVISAAILVVTGLTFGELLDSSPSSATPQPSLTLNTPQGPAATARRPLGHEGHPQGGRHAYPRGWSQDHHRSLRPGRWKRTRS
jgi:hypothetical protein